MSLTARRTCHCEAAAWRLQKMAYVVLEYAESIRTIKAAIRSGDYYDGAQCWFELDWPERRTLWIAPTKGGIFTTHERTVLRSQAWHEAWYGKEDA